MCTRVMHMGLMNIREVGTHGDGDHDVGSAHTGVLVGRAHADVHTRVGDAHGGDKHGFRL